MDLKELDNIFLLHKDKIPYSAHTKKRTDIKIKNNLCAYETAQNALKSNTFYDGIGIVLGNTSKGNLCGLDIDNCINEDGAMSENAREIVAFLDTYTEISISGNGIHCLFYANKKGKSCKNNNVDGCKCLELYDKNRFFTLSGNTLNNKKIEYRQKQCNVIYDKYFNVDNKRAPDKVTTSYNTTKQYNKSNINDYLSVIDKAMLKDYKLRSYWNGNRLYCDESRNDLGFFQKLAHYTDCNATIMQDLALCSPYFEQKDIKHKNKWLKRKDYLQRTINRAIDNYRSPQSEY